MSVERGKVLSWRIAVLVIVVCSITVLPAFAQAPVGAIDGVVRDESGAVLPGVTVEITSPSLIERTQSTVTDATGAFQFLRLPVGAYTAKFSLAGFNPIQRDDITINASFTATLEVVLKIGTLTETVSVSGASPQVDVRTNLQQLVVTSLVVNEIPSARHVFDMSKFVLGSTTATPDVGGSNGFQYTVSKIHGSRDMTYYIDGVSAIGPTNLPFSYGNTGAQAELDYMTTAIPAWLGFGGVVVSTVTKSGGDKFSGDFFADGQVAQSSNLDSSLMNLGVKATSGLQSAYDLDSSLGGPIKQGRAWFFVSNRTWMLNAQVANSFNPNGTQATDWSWRPENFYKTTIEINPTNKLSLFNTTTFYDRPTRRAGANLIAPEATYYDGHNHDNHFTTAIWTGTHGNSLLYDFEWNDFNRLVWNFYNDRVGPTDVARLDITESYLYGAPTSPNYSPQGGGHVNGSVTKLANWKGTHQIRTGAQWDWGHAAQNVNLNGNIILRFSNGIPNSVDLLNGPVANDNKMNNLGLFIQDEWRLDRLTINAGLRFDRQNSWIPAESSAAGAYVPARSFPELNVMTWNNPVPRLGVAYDVTGDSKTVVKGSFSEYVAFEGTTLASMVNPLTSTMNLCAWTDPNAPAPTISPGGYPELISTAFPTPSQISRCAGFPGVSTTIDPNLKRPISREYNVGLERQLTTNIVGSVNYFRRENVNLFALQNLAVPYDSYIPVTVTNPLTNQPMVIYNQNPATAGLQNNLLTNNAKLNDTFNGVEVAVRRRFSSTAYVQGGYAYGKDLGRTAPGEINDPNNDINTYGAVGVDQPHQAKVSAAFELPGHIAVSTFFQAESGLPRQITFTFTRTQVPTLTRASQLVDLQPNNVQRYPNIYLTDLRLGRIFRFGSTRFEAFADLYNLFNANTVLVDNPAFGSSLGQVSTTTNPRVLRIGSKFSF